MDQYLILVLDTYGTNSLLLDKVFNNTEEAEDYMESLGVEGDPNELLRGDYTYHVLPLGDETAFHKVFSPYLPVSRREESPAKPLDISPVEWDNLWKNIDAMNQKKEALKLTEEDTDLPLVDHYLIIDVEDDINHYIVCNHEKNKYPLIDKAFGYLTEHCGFRDHINSMSDVGIFRMNKDAFTLLETHLAQEPQTGNYVLDDGGKHLLQLITKDEYYELLLDGEFCSSIDVDIHKLAVFPLKTYFTTLFDAKGEGLLLLQHDSLIVDGFTKDEVEKIVSRGETLGDWSTVWEFEGSRRLYEGDSAEAQQWLSYKRR